MDQPATASASGPAVEMVGIGKCYPGVAALADVSFALRRGEIRALVGENGAGKSTLMRLLTGAEAPSAGEIRVHGQAVPRMTPALAEHLGIACVYQNLVLAEHLTVAENIWLGRLPAWRGTFLRRAELQARTAALLREIGYDGVIAPDDCVGHLSASQQGMVAIARALARDAAIVILDEPTAVLAEREVRELFRVIRLLRERHLAVVYISHRMEEVFDLCDTVTVLKDGRNAGEAAVRETSVDRLIAMMVGRELSASHFDPQRRPGEPLLSAEHIATHRVHDGSLRLCAGEIVGIYGLVGAGRTEFSRALFGRDRVRSGVLQVAGAPVVLRSPREAIGHGLSLVPEDRRRHGLALQLSVEHNLNLAVYGRHSRWGFVRHQREREVCRQYTEALRIKTPSPAQRVRHLSGGNQQKVVLGKWLAAQSRIFIMDEPTNGVDVGAKEEIYGLVNRMARDGAGVVFISSYMPELIDLCDRIVVMNGGRTVATVPRPQFDERRLLALAIRAETATEDPTGTTASGGLDHA